MVAFLSAAALFRGICWDWMDFLRAVAIFRGISWGILADLLGSALSGKALSEKDDWLDTENLNNILIIVLIFNQSVIKF